MKIRVLLAIAVFVFAVLLIGAGLSSLNLGSGAGVVPPQSIVPPEDIQFAPEDGPQPLVEVDQPTHDFKESAPEAESSHAFKFHNKGKYVLQLKEGPTDCRCMVSEADDDSRSPGEKWTKNVQPGETAEVTLKWKTTKTPGLFRKQATIWTNDRLHERVDLTIYGTIRAPVEVLPGAVNIQGMLSDETVTKQMQVLAARFERLTILEHRLEKNSAAEFIDVQYESMAADEVPKDYASGARLTVTIKPGLPYGASTQTIWLTTNVPNEDDLQIPVSAYVTPDITVAGKGYNSYTRSLRLGVVDSKEGIKKSLMLLVRGPRRADVEFQSPVTEPDCLRVELGKPKHLESVTQVPLSVEIPPGSDAVSRMGLQGGKAGEITIETTHPRMKQIRIPVKFAVEG